MAELVTFGETMLRLSPPAGQRIETEGGFDAQIGGAESNVAVAAAGLGVASTWLSKLPANPLGRRVVRVLRGHGVDPVVAWDDSETARLGTYYLERGADPRGTDVVYDRAGSSITTVATDELDRSVLDGADVFHTTGITPALSEAAAETTADLLSAAGEAGATRSFDLNYRSKLWSTAEARSQYESLFEAVDLLFAPLRDARSVLGYEGDAESIAYRLADDYDLETVVVTRGEAGSLAYTDGELYEQGIVDGETVDAIGTGDAFVGGVLAELLAGSDIDTALSYGAAAASLKRTLEGDVLVTSRGELEAVLDASTGGISR
ncbi:bifunctional 2-dehydro-3-deoxygluconokinase/2-dehydro-3-deoxygalactonokinase [Halohasta salina]|uniref:bifunctional 2-dehydro-3-deoxygluconokinase/2-dehydro-3- deoxygalactonokinase n=1 Tax=Halohasta salina TaxID=2961621 RepID=UPI0020A37720|nr:bifunctional 2-dehydro-3-deoxygluconokinase/2-dehydro-3-deoxygalactonokinase [Halohasta salina]